MIQIYNMGMIQMSWTTVVAGDARKKWESLLLSHLGKY